ncbi:MAG: bifunctional UDP-N-acetylglucosamine diphosphorylase/glucosamine-1-phosphate N-acetyltransferase GlmU [Bacteroides sp.]|nr:bifunctional UDP-N-acetylglucosamine diphosphorylase/glucosamine-1-phosphate N-acetyltransferase GlmU [Eubacterium sp.]MCM1418799.1 bifunctional UDP-N-acetylglucosamine diphosphorylase/glucosamine-1-phosphate N-acetyltransferase GlmU [Roseburia sp.]MCM1462456.1 bifunctional UDP-N-acetylglucosamine diphosphorylase/glucosamine-1-phosphate N-acetyltransferase GlmU [Bacteroides sp.]
MKKSAIILAAGDGKRMKSARPKVLCEVLEEPMLGWILDSVTAAGFTPKEIGIVIGNGAEAVTDYLAKRGFLKTYLQSERRGTGHAVLMALPLVEESEDVLVFNGDMPFVDAETIADALALHQKNGNGVTVVSAELSDPFGYGRIVLDDQGAFRAIVEEKNCTPEEAAIREINAGVYWFKAGALKDALLRLAPNPVSGEYYLTDTIELILAAGGRAEVYRARNADLVLGANSRADLLALNETARRKVIDKHLENGVEFLSTDGVIIGKDVRIGRDTKILPNTILRGTTEIGEGCIIGPSSVIENCRVGDGVVLNAVQAYSAEIRDRAKVGPFAHLRPGTILHEGVKIGDFVEVKNSEIGENTSAGHLTYIGDSDVGRGVNFGCGCVTANYDGINKYRTVIGDDAFIGCNTNLVAPVEIGANASTGAGSTITGNVPADGLAVERADTRIVEHWQKNKLRPKR